MNCRFCPAVIKKGQYCEPIDSQLQERELCFTCNFWLEYVERSGDPNSVRIDGDHYWICEDDKGPFRGFGGHVFTIKFSNGRIIKTSNLWSQGMIPLRFTEQLPNNAEFIQ